MIVKIANFIDWFYKVTHFNEPLYCGDSRFYIGSESIQKINLLKIGVCLRNSERAVHGLMYLKKEIHFLNVFFFVKRRNPIELVKQLLYILQLYVARIV